MELLLPGLGYFLYMLIAFIIVMVILAKFAWKPILKMLNDRETGIAESQEKAKAEFNRIVADARLVIDQQKNQAMIDVKNRVGDLVVELSEKILRRQLQDKSAQEAYINDLVQDVKLN